MGAGVGGGGMTTRGAMAEYDRRRLLNEAEIQRRAAEAWRNLGHPALAQVCEERAANYAAQAEPEQA